VLQILLSVSEFFGLHRARAGGARNGAFGGDAILFGKWRD
jgi:hypothetical protein